MPTELGRWLRAQRQARGWNVPEMTRRLRKAATETGDNLPANESLYTMIRRWERGETGVSERYLLHYCRALGIQPEKFGPLPQPSPATIGVPHDPPPVLSLTAAARALRAIKDGLHAAAGQHQASADACASAALLIEAALAALDLDHPDSSATLPPTRHDGPPPPAAASAGTVPASPANGSATGL